MLLRVRRDLYLPSRALDECPSLLKLLDIDTFEIDSDTALAKELMIRKVCIKADYQHQTVSVYLRLFDPMEIATLAPKPPSTLVGGVSID